MSTSSGDRVNLQIITQLILADIQPLLVESLAEGYTFIQRLWDEYQSGENTFREDGAALIGGYHHDRLVAVGGIQPDPYLNIPTIGRIRHVYVLPGYRRNGIGKQLVETLIAQTSGQFSTFTLRTVTQHGSAFYRTLGFVDQPRYANASHWLEVEQTP